MAKDFAPEAASNAEGFRTLRPEDLSGPSGPSSPNVHDIQYIDEKGNLVDGPRPTYRAVPPPQRPSAPRPRPAPRAYRPDPTVVHVHNTYLLPTPPTPQRVVDNPNYGPPQPPQYAIESVEQEAPRHGMRRVLGFLSVVALVSVGYAGYKQLTAPEDIPSANSIVASPVPGNTETVTPAPQNDVEGIDPTSPSIDLNSLSQTSPSATDTNASKPTAVSKKTSGATSSAKAKAPDPTTEDSSALPSKTKTETKASHHVSYELSPDMANVIASTVDQGRLSFLEDSNPQVRDFMNQQNLASTVNLSTITTGAIDAYRKETNELSAKYSTWDGGISKYYNSAALTDHSQVAGAMVAQTDRVLEYASYAYRDDPQLRVVDLAYWSPDLQYDARSNIRQALSEGKDPSQTGYTEAEDASVIGVATQRLSDGSTIDLVATWSSYGADQNGQEVEKIRWELPVKIDAGNDYVNVTVAEIDASSQASQYGRGSQSTQDYTGNHGSHGNHGNPHN